MPALARNHGLVQHVRKDCAHNHSGHAVTIADHNSVIDDPNCIAEKNVIYHCKSNSCCWRCRREETVVLSYL